MLILVFLPLYSPMGYYIRTPCCKVLSIIKPANFSYIITSVMFDKMGHNPLISEELKGSFYYYYGCHRSFNLRNTL